jgi:hemerythrin
MKGSKSIHNVVDQFKRLMPVWVIEHIMTQDKKIGQALENQAKPPLPPQQNSCLLNALFL